MKVLVTGGAGFIGSHVVDCLVKKNYQVVVVDDLSTGRREHVNPAAKFFTLDIRDKQGLEKIFEREKPDVVNHHAAQVNLRRSVTEPVFDVEVNLLGSLNLIECSVKSGVKQFIYISTGGAVYGEPQHLPVREDHIIAPLSPYGINKHTVEHYLFVYGKDFGLPYTVLRYPNVYGPRQDPKGEAGVVAVFSKQMLTGETSSIFGDGNKTRDYVYVTDIVEANILVVESSCSGEAFNLGWGKEVKDIEIFNSVRKALGVKVEPIFEEKRPGEIDRICLNAQKIKRTLGWKPTVTLAKGISLATSYYKDYYSH